MRDLIIKLVTQSKRATAGQLAQITAQADLAPFAADLLEVDEALWGGFWQGDVIAPGYRLPAVELALLRAIRLDSTWPEGATVAKFLADLRAAILDPQAGIWTVMAAGEPCVIFASVHGAGSVVSGQKASVNDQPTAGSQQPVVTVVWYCATTGHLHAGYRTAVEALNFEGAVEQRPLRDSGLLSPAGQQSILTSEQTLNREDTSDGRQSYREASHLVVDGQALAARLDAGILQFRRPGS